MHKIGFIGYGSMGSMLVNCFINSGQISQEQVIVTRKDKARLDEIKRIWPKICVSDDITYVVKESKYIFICVKPLDYKGVLNEIKPYILPDKHIISIAGSVSIENLESIIDCKITKFIPTVISEVNEGISLICHNSKVTDEDARFIEKLIGSISKFKVIDEKHFGFAAEITSCAPGFIAAVFQEFVEAAFRHTSGISRDEITEMTLYTLYGTSKLMLEKNMDFEAVVSRVATKGGITEEGAKVIKAGMPQVFDEMFEKTLGKREMIVEKVNREFK